MAATATLSLMKGGTIHTNIGKISEVLLLELLGMGAFGSVWKVQDIASGIVYALKVIQGLAPDSVMCDRVRLEAEVVIPSKFIVPAIGLRQWDENTYLILFAYFEAKPLDEWLVAGILTPDHKRKIYQQLLWGVRDAHRCNIIHRDLKPGNVLVNRTHEVKLIDFGISKFRGMGLTKTGEVMGTLPYMPPEAIVEGAVMANARTDIYALGHILYELEMGQHFWQRRGWGIEHFGAYLKQIPNPTEAIDLGDFVGECYPNSAEVIAQMVKVSYDDRIATVSEVLAALGVAEPEEDDVLPLDSIGFPLLILESGTNRDACLPASLQDGENRTIGRADIAGNDASISRKHIELRREGNHYFLRNLSSKGTLHSGNFLAPGSLFVQLHHGDRIKVGDIFLRVEFREGL